MEGAFLSSGAGNCAERQVAVSCAVEMHKALPGGKRAAALLVNLERPCRFGSSKRPPPNYVCIAGEHDGPYSWSLTANFIDYTCTIATAQSGITEGRRISPRWRCITQSTAVLPTGQPGRFGSLCLIGARSISAACRLSQTPSPSVSTKLTPPVRPSVFVGEHQCLVRVALCAGRCGSPMGHQRITRLD